MRHDENVSKVLWSGADVYFSGGYLLRDIFSVPARGGDVVVRATCGEDLRDLHGFDVRSGDGVVVAALHYEGNADSNTIACYEDGRWKPVHTVSNTSLSDPRIAPDGSLVYRHGGEGLWRLPLSGDGDSREPSRFGTGISDFSMAADGTVAYIVADAERRGGSVAWFAADGTPTPIETPRAGLLFPRLSPDGRRMLFVTGDASGESQICIHDLDRNFATPFIKCEQPGIPFFLPDGRIATRAPAAAGTLVYPASGKTEPTSFEGRFLVDVSYDGSAWLWSDPSGDEQFWTRGADAEERLPLFGRESQARFVDLSRDGSWMLYASMRTGEPQVYLTRFPPSETEDWAVTSAGAGRAWFLDDQSAIVFVTANPASVHRVSLKLEPEVQLGTPELLFDVPERNLISDFDGVDGFLGSARAPPGERRLVISTEWRELWR